MEPGGQCAHDQQVNFRSCSAQAGSARSGVRLLLRLRLHRLLGTWAGGRPPARRVSCCKGSESWANTASGQVVNGCEVRTAAAAVVKLVAGRGISGVGLLLAADGGVNERLARWAVNRVGVCQASTMRPARRRPPIEVRRSSGWLVGCLSSGCSQPFDEHAKNTEMVSQT